MSLNIGNHPNYIEDENNKFSYLRFILGCTVGFVIGMYLIAAISAGIKFRYEEEYLIENWNGLFWGEHYLIRAIWSFVATWLGGFIAGLVSRRKGNWAGVTSVIPGTLVWVAGIYVWLFTPEFFTDLGFATVSSWENKLMSILIVIISPLIAHNAGGAGEECSNYLSTHFDSQKHSFLGMKWYHVFWIPVYLYLIIVQTAWSMDYAMSWYLLSIWETTLSFWGIIQFFFLVATWGTLYLTYIGLTQAYCILINLDDTLTYIKKMRSVLKYGIGYPVLAIVGQGLISLLHYGLVELLE